MSPQKNYFAKILSSLIKIYLLTLPWQTVWIVQERYLNGYKWQYGTLQFFLSELFAWTTFLVFFLWSWQKLKVKLEKKKIKFSWTHDRVFILFVLLFLVYSFLSIIWSLDKEIAFQHSFYFLESFLLFFVIYLGPNPKKEIIGWLLLGSVVPTVLGVTQFVTQATWSSKWLGLSLYLPWEAGTSIVSGGARWLRAYGSFPHPNIFGGYLAIILILLFYYIYNHPIKELFRKIIFNFVIVILSGALFFSFSRSAWMAVGLAMAVFVFFGLLHKTLSKNIVVFLSIPIIIFVIGGIIHSPLVKVRLGQSTVSEITSVQERVSGFGEAKNMILKHPWLGVGSGNYTVAGFLLNNKRPGWEYQPVHNVLLLLIAEMGIVGLFIFIGILASFIRFFLTLESRKSAYFSLILSLSIIPILSLDHYFLSGYFGLMLIAVYFGAIFKHDVHS